MYANHFHFRFLINVEKRTTFNALQRCTRYVILDKLEAKNAKFVLSKTFHYEMTFLTVYLRFFANILNKCPPFAALH
jgi:hypothetical protein